ncbi:MAG: 3-oxoadipate enol-lactonase [Fimbriimonadaceae bacterium]|nr:3-oxoadipate enol-lactonase [Alphaproteobacteria bacterium]
MPKIAINGANIHYEVNGRDDSPTLLMSNSLGTNLHMWDWQMDILTPHFRVIRYDSRGHGQSDAPDEDYSIEMLAGDELGILNHLNVEKTLYCGLSKGGMIGQWLGAHAPERIERLVLANTSAHMPEGMISWKDRVRKVRAESMTSIVDMVADIWFTKEFQAQDPEAIGKVREMILSTPPIGYGGCCMAIAGMDNRESNKTIRVPTLVIVGANDIATPPDHGAAIHAAIPDSKIVTLNGAHLSNIADAKGFNDALIEFLT